MNNIFSPMKTNILKGITLIEASAGTGKTYTIGMLVVRFVVEKQIPLDKILVVTFTKAATEELKNRIRMRLSEAKRALKGKTTGIDENILEWIENLPVERERALQLLELALYDIDQAGIFTIHGFCHRVLKEHALESGQLFDSELCKDINFLKQQIVDDLWRKELYQRSATDVVALTEEVKTPDDLYKSVKNIDLNIKVYPEFKSLQQILDSIYKERIKLIEWWNKNSNQIFKKLSEGINSNKFKIDFRKSFEENYKKVNDYLLGQQVLMPGEKIFNSFSHDSIKEQLKVKNKHLAEEINCPDFQLFLSLLKEIKICFRRITIEKLAEQLEIQLKQLNTLSFDQLIFRLSDAIDREKGGYLTRELQNRFHVALVDEFQDTDKSQWKIFSKLFNSENHFLYLIGDPKQAIYKFRGADIFSYFSAKKLATHQFTLKKNWRSHPSLVNAVNTLFNPTRINNPFLFKELEFNIADAALDLKDGVLYDGLKKLQPMALWQLDKNPEKKDGFWTSDKAREQIKISTVNEILKLLNPDGSITIQENNQVTPVKPGDIAIIVRTNDQAKEFQDILRDASIPSILNSTKSVFSSKEAVHLFKLLDAIVHPGDMNRLKETLTLDWFSMDGQQLYKLMNNEREMDGYLSRFQKYHLIWQEEGFMSMMLALLEKEKIRINLSNTLKAERRLTDLNHIIEVIQQTVVDEHLGIHKIPEWLNRSITEQSEQDELQQRMESDKEGINIITAHRSKGLEYPIVFCPYLWNRSTILQKENNLVKCHEDGEIVADLGSPDFERRHKQALYEELAEDLRLLYVVLTRAKYRSYLVWADVRSKNTPNISSLAYLLHGSGEDMVSMAETDPSSFEYKLIKNQSNLNGVYMPVEPALTFSFKKQTRSLKTCWQMSSYSALSLLTINDAPELPHNKAQEPDISEIKREKEPGTVINFSEIPKGAHAGNVIHDLLEKIPFKKLAEDKDISEHLNRSCQRYGLKMDNPGLIGKLLQKTVQTPLSKDDPKFCLSLLKEKECLKELPFYYSFDSIKTGQINRILKKNPTFLELNEKKMEGYLTGFIDLVCKYKDRFYVMDYKSNGLENYKPENLTEAMKAHNYGLQYWIYTLVLHQYLKHRLTDYDYEKHFGGVRYLFVRGMIPEQAMSGVFHDSPDLETLEKLEKLLGSPNEFT